MASELVSKIEFFVIGFLKGIRYDELNRLMLYAFQDVYSKYEEQKQETRNVADKLVEVLARLDKYDRLDNVLRTLDIQYVAGLCEMVDAVN